MGRAPCCDKGKVKRGPWSPDEDEVLRNYVQKYGTGGNWIALPHKAGLKRCGKSCRLRWLNYLRPDIKHGGFTEEEDNIICTLYKKLGSRWSVITSHLPGRTDNDVKNYWNTKLKKKLSATQNNLSNNPSINNTNTRIHNTKTESIDSSLTTPFMEASTSILPTRQISFNCNLDSQFFFQDPNLFSCRGPKELTSMSPTITKYSASSASQEASTITLDNTTWSGLVGDELDSLSMDFGCVYTYENLGGYGYPVKANGETPCSTSFAYPDFAVSDDNLEGLYKSVTY